MTNSPLHILVVDDDKEIRTLLADFLQNYGYQISSAQDGVEMFKVLDEHTIDLIILDLMMPGDDGLTLCQKVRQTSQVPIVMLTAIDEETDRIIGLEMGADDYIAKPFNPRELLARIKAIFRRIPDVSEHEETDPTRQCIHFCGWQFDMCSRTLLAPDEMEVTLSTGEFDLLSAFVEHPQRVLSRDQLLDFTKNREAGPFDRSIDVQISRLRHKIEVDPKAPALIKTVRGGGYLFTPEIEKC